MFIQKAQAGSAPGYTWEKDGDVIDVDDDMAYDLLNIPNGGFSQAAPPAPTPEPAEDPVDEPQKRKGGRPRLPRDDDGNIIRPDAETTESE